MSIRTVVTSKPDTSDPGPSADSGVSSKASPSPTYRPSSARGGPPGAHGVDVDRRRAPCRAGPGSRRCRCSDPVAVRNGNSSAPIRLVRRTSAGSSPSARATMSTARSITKWAASLPNPRAAFIGGLFVVTTWRLDVDVEQAVAGREGRRGHVGHRPARLGRQRTDVGHEAVAQRDQSAVGQVGRRVTRWICSRAPIRQGLAAVLDPLHGRTREERASMRRRRPPRGALHLQPEAAADLSAVTTRTRFSSQAQALRQHPAQLVRVLARAVDGQQLVGRVP